MEPFSVKAYFKGRAERSIRMFDLKEALRNIWASTNTVKALPQAGVNVNYQDDEDRRYPAVSLLDQDIRREYEANIPPRSLNFR